MRPRLSMPQDVFEEYAKDYDRWFDEHRDVYLSELARIRTVLPPLDNRSIEVGVGSGRFAAPLGITLGIEPSRALGLMARDRGIEILRGRAEDLPIKERSCSSVLLVTVLCFLDNPTLALREIHRILIPDGFIIVAFIIRGGRIHQKYIQDGTKGKFLSRARFYSPEEVVALLKDTRFRVVRIDSRAGFCIIAAQK